MPTPIRKPMRPLNEMIRIFAEQADEAMTANFATQRIWPFEVYKNYKTVNEERKRRAGGDPDKGWFSTGEGFKSFRFIPHAAATAGEMTIDVTFNNYLRYVDVGVGAGRFAGDVKRSSKANYAKRYNKWPNTANSYGNLKSGKTHRPAILMELRHVLSRMRNYAVDFYGYEGEGILIKTFEGLDIEL